MLSGWELRVEEAMRFIACSQDSEGHNLTFEQRLLAGLQNKRGWRRDLNRAGMFPTAWLVETRTLMRTGAWLHEHNKDGILNSRRLKT
jgi:catechol-2,3-dioxygenase